MIRILINTLILCIVIALITTFLQIIYSYTVKVIETYDVDAHPVDLWYIVDGDTVRLKNGTYVRIVGYNAWEKSEPLGLEAREYLGTLCSKRIIYLDVDDYESRDRYGRILGYVWCQVNGAYVPITKMFLLVRPDLVKNKLYIPPDEHPYWQWTTRYRVKFKCVKNIIVINGTGKYVFRDGVVTLTGGVYDVFVGNQHFEYFRKLILLNGSTTLVLNLCNYILKGDADNNGVLEINDVVLILEHVIGLVKVNVKTCDINGNDVCDIGDAALVMMMIVQKLRYSLT